MKTSFSVVNLVGGILALIFGLIVILTGPHNPAAIFVGVVALVLSVSCLWLTKESGSTSSD